MAGDWDAGAAIDGLDARRPAFCAPELIALMYVLRIIFSLLRRVIFQVRRLTSQARIPLAHAPRCSLHESHASHSSRACSL